MRDIDNSTDLIDVRNIIERYEELEDMGEDVSPDVREERIDLWNLLESLEGSGGDEQWRGDWYPVTLIRDSYFKEYAQELAEDIGAIPDNATWPCRCIDWDRAARELRMDYSAVEYGGVTYWTR